MSYSVGVDIGGMSIKIGLVENGKIVTKSSFQTLKDKDENIQSLIREIDKIISQNDLTYKDIIGIGLGCPGLVDSKKGLINYLPNLDGWTDVPLAEILNCKFGVPVKLGNDANVATFAEVKYGCAKDYNSAVMFTLGTGVGGGIIIDGEIFEGEQSKGTELGHVVLVLDGEECGCGRRGCLEAYVSATALIRQTKREMQKNRDTILWDYVGNDINNVDGRASFECMKRGDAVATIICKNYIKYLAESIMNMCNIFRPQVFILGGGISAQGDYLVRPLKEYLQKYNYGLTGAPKVEILIATLGNDAGIIGAATLVE